MQQSELTKEDYEELAEFRYRLRKFERFSENAARNIGVTPSQHQLLLAIKGYPRRNFATPTELAERLQLRHNSCLGLIQRSESAGLVERFDNPEDKRSIFIRLTEQGDVLLDKLTALHKMELQSLGLVNFNIFANPAMLHEPG
jgi:DNA-binding MarR family transcriptional regulator